MPPAIAMCNMVVLWGAELRSSVFICNAELVNETITVPYKVKSFYLAAEKIFFQKVAKIR